MKRRYFLGLGLVSAPALISAPAIAIQMTKIEKDINTKITEITEVGISKELEIKNARIEREYQKNLKAFSEADNSFREAVVASNSPDASRTESYDDFDGERRVRYGR